MAYRPAGPPSRPGAGISGVIQSEIIFWDHLTRPCMGLSEILVKDLPTVTLVVIMYLIPSSFTQCI